MYLDYKRESIYFFIFLMRNALVVRIVERLGDCLQKIVENDD